MTYSVQQIKFECLAYIKEFGAKPRDWMALSCTVPERLFTRGCVDEQRDIWLWKPALSPVAASAVVQFLLTRMGIKASEADDPPGRFVFIYRKADE